MTTISHRRRRRLPPVSTLVAVFLLFVLVVVVNVWRTEVGNLFWTIVAPIASVRNSLDATTSAALRAELASTTALIADRNALYQENLLLKAQFGRDAKVRSVLASVLLRPPGTPYDTLVIDAGKKEGVKMGALVSAGGSAYIGTISEVFESTSRVLLFSSPGSTYSALAVLSSQPGKSIPISLVGQGGGSMSAEVPAATPVSVGDTIIVPGVATAFAGTVTHVERSEGESFETLYAHLPVDLFSIRFVEVRLDGVQP